MSCGPLPLPCTWQRELSSQSDKQGDHYPNPTRRPTGLPTQQPREWRDPGLCLGGSICFKRDHLCVFPGAEESLLRSWRRRRIPAPSPRTLHLRRLSLLPSLPPSPSGGPGRSRPEPAANTAPRPAAAACGPGGPRAPRTEAAVSPSPRGECLWALGPTEASTLHVWCQTVPSVLGDTLPPQFESDPTFYAELRRSEAGRCSVRVSAWRSGGHSRLLSPGVSDAGSNKVLRRVLFWLLVYWLVVPVPWVACAAGSRWFRFRPGHLSLASRGADPGQERPSQSQVYSPSPGGGAREGRSGTLRDGAGFANAGLGPREGGAARSEPELGEEAWE